MTEMTEEEARARIFELKARVAQLEAENSSLLLGAKLTPEQFDEYMRQQAALMEKLYRPNVPRAIYQESVYLPNVQLQSWPTDNLSVKK